MPETPSADAESITAQILVLSEKGGQACRDRADWASGVPFPVCVDVLVRRQWRGI